MFIYLYFYVIIFFVLMYSFNSLSMYNYIDSFQKQNPFEGTMYKNTVTLILFNTIFNRCAIVKAYLIRSRIFPSIESNSSWIEYYNIKYDNGEPDSKILWQPITKEPKLTIILYYRINIRAPLSALSLRKCKIWLPIYIQEVHNFSRLHSGLNTDGRPYVHCNNIKMIVFVQIWLRLTFFHAGSVLKKKREKKQE